MAHRPASPVLAARALSKSFGATQALADFDFTVNSGEIVALMGANGAGKSTLVNILSGELAPDNGAMTLNGRRYAPFSPRDGARAGIAVVHQATDRAGAPGLTVAETLALNLLTDRSAPFFLSRGAIRRYAATVAANAGFDLPLDLDFGGLGPADRQLVAIARALAADASLLILDEPTASLSSAETERLFGHIEAMRARGLAIVYISHRTSDLARLADRVVVLRGGRLAGSFSKPIDFDAAVTAMINRPVQSAHAMSRPVSGPVVFALDALRLTSDSAPIDLTVRQGEVVAITGLLGAGKSRLLNAIFGTVPFHSGTVSLDGQPFRPHNPAASIAAGVVLAGEDRHRSSFLPPDWPGGTVAGTISLPHLKRWFPNGLIHRRVETRAANRAITRLGIRASGPHAPLDTLSGGNQQKVILARWQAEPARLLLLDEPFQGVDIGARADIIAALRNTTTTATLIATSDPEEALEAADRIFVMDRHALGPWAHTRDSLNVSSPPSRQGAAP